MTLIRELNHEDLPQMATFLSTLESAKWTQNCTLAEIIQELDQRLAAKTEAATLWIAENDALEILGYCSVHWIPNLVLAGSEGYLSELFVSPYHRGQGIGDLLLAAAEKEAKERGCYRLMLLNLKDRESYQRGFYTKRNWVERPDAANMVKRIHSQQQALSGS